MKSIRNLFLSGKASLSAAGIENPEFDAKQMLSQLTGISPGDIPHCEKPVSSEISEKFAGFLSRRTAREPLQYILGEWEFYSLPIRLCEGVLIPRPETELLVDKAIEAIKNIESPKILDLCTGSGCIAAALAKSRPDAQITAADYYEIPLKIAAENLKSLAPLNTEVEKINILSPPPSRMKSRFHLITANPPYLTEQEMSALQPEVKKEPPEALQAGADGLMFYRALAEHWKKALRPDGIIVAEIGYLQGPEVYKIFEKAFISINIYKDLSGNDRIITGKKERI